MTDSAASPSPSPSSISVGDLTLLNAEITALVQAGVPLPNGLRQIAASQPGRVAGLAEELNRRLQSGGSLPESIESSRAFPRIYSAMVTAGIRAGRLPAALEELATCATNFRDLRRRIVDAMVYPLIVSLLAYGLFVLVISLVSDRVDQICRMLNLPASRLVQTLAFAARLHPFWYLIPPLIVLLLIILWVWNGRAAAMDMTGWRSPLSWVPGLRRLGRTSSYAGFSRLLAMLCEARVPFAEAMELAGAACGNRRLANSAIAVAQQHRHGKTFDEIEAAVPKSAIPSFLIWSIRRGMATNRLPESLRSTESIYRRRADEQMLWIRRVFPIVSGIGIGGTVTALYALATFLPFIEIVRAFATEY